ncbi:hypothetical protein M3M33_15645, partial [Loigolactobacillus coryniformis]|uniref:hypothetical protein n=1 Tax=Loigolactobacillus coryniformis TaxID=1610 RepID=UPI00201AA7E5
MSDPMYDGICEPRERIHRGARHALHDDPWRAEKAAQAVEVERRLDAAQKAGKRQAVRLQANREA